MKTKGRRQSKNVSRVDSSPNLYQLHRTSQVAKEGGKKIVRDAERSIPKHVDDMMERAAEQDVLDRIMKSKIPRSAR